MPGHHTSVTLETSWGEVAKYVPLSPDLSDISKLDSTEGKFILLPEYLTEGDV